MIKNNTRTISKKNFFALVQKARDLGMLIAYTENKYFYKIKCKNIYYIAFKNN